MLKNKRNITYNEKLSRTNKEHYFLYGSGFGSIKKGLSLVQQSTEDNKNSKNNFMDSVIVEKAEPMTKLDRTIELKN